MVSKEIMKAVGSEMLSLVDLGFDAQKNPYGTSWAKIRRAGRILQKTGIMRNSFKVRYSGSAVSVFASVDYAKYHQFGTKNKDGSLRMVRRMMVPGAGGLPRAWRMSLDEAVNEAIALKVANAR